MTNLIEMTTDLSGSPARVKFNLGIVVGILMLSIVAEWLLFGTHGVTRAIEPGNASLSPLQNILGLLFIVTSGLFGYVFALGTKQRLSISRSYIEWHTRLPRWVARNPTNWRIAREDIRSVVVDLRGVSFNPLKARVTFDCNDASKSIKLFGWHRIGAKNEVLRRGPKRGFIKTNWENEISVLPLIIALREAGLNPTVVTG